MTMGMKKKAARQEAAFHAAIGRAGDAPLLLEQIKPQLIARGVVDPAAWQRIIYWAINNDAHGVARLLHPSEDQARASAQMRTSQVVGKVAREAPPLFWTKVTPRHFVKLLAAVRPNSDMLSLIAEADRTPGDMRLDLGVSIAMRLLNDGREVPGPIAGDNGLSDAPGAIQVPDRRVPPKVVPGGTSKADAALERWQHECRVAAEKAQAKIAAERAAIRAALASKEE